MTRLTFLGTADAFNGAGRANSCYWLQTDGGTFAVDFGPTALQRLKLLDLDADRIDAVWLTHLHGDHIGGLPLLLIELWFRARRTRPLIIGGPPGTRARIEQLIDCAYPSILAKAEQCPIEFIEWDLPGVIERFGLRIDTIRARHDALAMASSLRISVEGGPVLSFSGDSGWQDTLAALAADADAFICECSSVTAGYWGHISVEEIRQHRAALTAKAVYLTHLGTEARAAAIAAAAELAVVVADDGMVLEF